MTMGTFSACVVHNSDASCQPKEWRGPERPLDRHLHQSKTMLSEHIGHKTGKQSPDIKHLCPMEWVFSVYPNERQPLQDFGSGWGWAFATRWAFPPIITALKQMNCFHCIGQRGKFTICKVVPGQASLADHRWQSNL